MTNWRQYNPLPRGVYPIDTRRFRCAAFTFEPKGPVKLIGTRAQNPVVEEFGAADAGRLFVGLNVGGKPRWKVEDVMRITKRVRERQGADPDSSFLAQRGYFTSAGKTINEKSVQIIILDFAARKTGGRTFKTEMIELAEELARKLKQETIYVEIQRNGIPERVLRVIP